MHVKYRFWIFRGSIDELNRPKLEIDRLDWESQRLLDRSGSPEKAGRNAVELSRQTTELRPGTILGREWNGQMQQVAVLADGFRRRMLSTGPAACRRARCGAHCGRAQCARYLNSTRRSLVLQNQ
jgi:hypothetical protein